MHSVSLIRCQDYDVDRVRVAVRQAVDLLGGMGRFVHPGDRVVVKPNLLRSSKPEQAIVTHPAVLRAVVELVHQAGGQVIIADSPGGPLSSPLMRRAYQQAGWAAVAQETGATLNFNFTGMQQSFPEGRLIKRFDILEEVAKADCVISLPKLKTHGLMRFTGATKILFGVVPGVLKLGYHTKLQTASAFAEMLLDLLEMVKPRLAIMDAVVGMEGKGPSAGSPRQIGAILASPNSVALDVVAASLVGMEPLSIPVLKAAAQRGLTSGSAQDVNILGDSLAALRVPDFKPPPSNPDIDAVPSVMPVALRRWLTGQLLLTPSADPVRCTGCQTCFQNCPVQAISMINQKARMDPNKCIRCYCCHELCPENAIDLRRGRLGQLVIH